MPAPSGHGFKLAPALGGHIADLVTDEEVSPGLEQFHPKRFIEGRDIPSGFERAEILG